MSEQSPIAVIIEGINRLEHNQKLILRELNKLSKRVSS